MEWETAFKRIEELEKIVSALEVRLDRQYELTKEILHRFDNLERRLGARSVAPAASPCVTPAIQPILIEKAPQSKTKG